MATHSGILAWRVPMDRGAWWAASPLGRKDLDTTKWLTHTHTPLYLVAQSCPALCDPTDCLPPDSSVHGDSPAKDTGVGCHALLQGIFPNPVFLHCRWILYHLSHQRSPKVILLWPSSQAFWESFFQSLKTWGSCWFSIVEQISSSFHKGFRLSDNLLMFLWVQQYSPISTSDYINLSFKSWHSNPKCAPVIWFWVLISSSFFLLANLFVRNWNSDAIKITVLSKKIK